MTSTFNPGDIVAGYTIESVLGVGGMGVVYKAKNPQLPRSDALKVLTTSIQGDGQFRERFLREANVAATLGHYVDAPHSTGLYTDPPVDVWSSSASSGFAEEAFALRRSSRIFGPRPSFCKQL